MTTVECKTYKRPCANKVRPELRMFGRWVLALWQHAARASMGLVLAQEGLLVVPPAQACVWSLSKKFRAARARAHFYAAVTRYPLPAVRGNLNDRSAWKAALDAIGFVELRMGSGSMARQVSLVQKWRCVRTNRRVIERPPFPRSGCRRAPLRAAYHIKPSACHYPAPAAGLQAPLPRCARRVERLMQVTAVVCVLMNAHSSALKT